MNNKNKIRQFNKNMLKEYNNVKNMKNKYNKLKKILRRRNKSYQKQVIKFNNI